ncbi:MAG: cytochrome c oxidase assembly protein [Hyphomicrobiaceae bacterium]|jgi:cytochrome c oxidase assembly protein subunit 11|uniref:Cytochrome c oxidase assembly protein CtaG n=1 Tax=marine sediment metagenome TaxID=412755 RepID=X0SKX4_9ZZZZ|nr:cytochrome c oxidase assembly protein [Methyloceanibacter sp.]MDX2318423.1 cytochrome c oxidase assembly protein [Hyphomicrobiaceae bacterium]MDX2450450.1 cytochrome c oxidase assembly protein [Hyphomicrobiaceae bacterium]
MSSDNSHKGKRDRKGLVALSLAGLVAGMVGLSFAAVPLYRIFCQTTGYGGVPQQAEAAPGTVLDRTITVRFDANVDRKLPWTFEPVQRVMDVKIGESNLAFFRATNNTDEPVTGSAGFNVAPGIAGRYFTKIECFCFTKQRLAAGESIEMPVTFFVDPKIVDDESAKNISEITLSYTFYRNDDQSDVVAAGRELNSGS